MAAAGLDRDPRLYGLKVVVEDDVAQFKGQAASRKLHYFARRRSAFASSVATMVRLYGQ